MRYPLIHLLPSLLPPASFPPYRDGLITQFLLTTALLHVAQNEAVDAHDSHTKCEHGTRACVRGCNPHAEQGASR
jgi:hypothetical protein